MAPYLRARKNKLIVNCCELFLWLYVIGSVVISTRLKAIVSFKED